MLDADTISTVTDLYRAERAALVGLLSTLDADQWRLPTQCPNYSVQGVASHLLGDDLSLLSRQRDEADSGLLQMAHEMPGHDFMSLLDAFNDRWVEACQFFSGAVLIALLEASGDWTASYYESVDPAAPGEPVGIFGATGPTSPMWQSIAREYLERWTHHSQIRRALGLTSLSDSPYPEVGLAVVAAIARLEAEVPSDPAGPWSMGPIVFGDRRQTADVLTRAHTHEELSSLVTGPDALTGRLFAALSR